MLDKLFTLGEGRRTEILGLVYMIFQILGIFGVIDPHKVHEVESVVLPAAGVTFAAKIGRGMGVNPAPPAAKG